jgi:glycosyltransferase involved in cell wall biosynthesis
MVYCKDEENCLIVPKENAQATVDACLRVVEDPSLIAKLQKGGLETAQQWPWEPVIDDLERIYG